MRSSGGTDGGKRFLYINDKHIKPLQIYLRDILVSFNTQLGSQAQSMLSGDKVFVQSVQMAAIVITMLPILCLYPFLQKIFCQGRHDRFR